MKEGTQNTQNEHKIPKTDGSMSLRLTQSGLRAEPVKDMTISDGIPLVSVGYLWLRLSVSVAAIDMKEHKTHKMNTKHPKQHMTVL